MNTQRANQFDIAIVGAGIHGMHILGGILEAARNNRALARGIVLIDEHPRPFSTWRRRVRNCSMEYLRSPASHSAGLSFRDLRHYARTGGSRGQGFTPPYHRPAVRLFDEHLDIVESKTSSPAVTRSTGRVINVVRARGDAPYELRLAESDRPILAKRVVLALGQPDLNVPEAFNRCTGDDRVIHVYDARFDPYDYRPGDRVLVVGGGIAAAHLILHYLKHPVETVWWYRDPISLAQFDSNPCFIGPRCRSLWDSIDDPETRRTLIRRSRRNGSVPPDRAIPVFEALRSGHLRSLRGDVRACLHSGNRRIIRGDAGGLSVDVECDRVVLATGFVSAVPQAEIIAACADALGLTRTADGFPIVSPSLEWAPGLYCAGALAEHEIGPPARNIIGAHLARRRIVPAIMASLES